MANFYATYSTAGASGDIVTALQGTVPWVVDGQGTPGTPIGGLVTIQGDPAGTPIPTTLTTTTAVFQAEGSVAAASITASYVTLITPAASTKVLQMRNNTDESVAVSLDAGATTSYVLDLGDMVSLDLHANALTMGGVAIQVKYVSTPPTTGSFRVNACH